MFTGITDLCVLATCVLKVENAGSFETYSPTAMMTGASVTSTGTITMDYSGYKPMGTPLIF